MRVKICGITSVEDAQAAAEAGADAIGLNFVGGPRQIPLNRAAEILRALPPLVTPVALVRLTLGVMPDPLFELLGEYWVSHLQLYGELTAEDLAQLLDEGFHPMPVVAVRDERFADQVAQWIPAEGRRGPHAVVLDAYDPSRVGGTGTSFRWEWVPAARQAGKLHGAPSIILAGGLRPENVVDAVRLVQPYGVDVSSGVEVDGLPGKKDPAKMAAFVHLAKGVC